MEVVLATERYGSGEAWEYVTRRKEEEEEERREDGGAGMEMERRRDGAVSGGGGGGNYMIGVFKSVVGVAGGATRAALTVHQARRDNMADISAKDGSQTELWLLTLGLFFVFTALHLFANYKAVRSVVMETFNEARLSVVLREYLRSGRVLRPADGNRQEPVFLDFRNAVSIKLGVKLSDIAQSQEELELALKSNSHKSYLLGVKPGSVCVCLAPGASVCDQIRAACQALCLESLLQRSSTENEP
ncbi:hypothetical protein CRUP_008492, partial [Coryphaenoides rupestris]